MDIFIKKNEYLNINIFYLYKDNQIERIIEIDFNFDPFIINRIQNSK
jgi:hypothetical protein